MLLLEHTPRFNVEDAVSLADAIYGFSCAATLLPSERDQNFLLQAESGERFVLKIANALENPSMLIAQQQAMMRIAERASICPRVVKTKLGEDMRQVQSREGASHFVRLVTYLPGVPLGDVKRHSPELLQDLGRKIGELDRALEGFDHPALNRDFHWDIANGLRVCREYESLISDVELRKLVGKLADDFARNVEPLLPELRAGVIHNDANDYNVIVGGGGNISARNQSVVGIIDFGDMVRSYTVGDLAVAIAYAILDKPDPLAAAAHIVKGYNSKYPLNENEIESLFGLVRMRLCMSVGIAAHQQRQRPDDDYLAISQRPIRNTLPRLAAIHPRHAAATFRHACRLSPVRSSVAVMNYLRSNTQRFASVLPADLREAPCVVFDLSVGSPLVSGDARENNEPKLTRRLFDCMASAGVSVGVGRYDEPRLLYTEPMFSTEAERRVVHLGIDLFAEAGTPIFAPLAGAVHAFANNAAPQDYGPVIILKHSIDDGHVFFTLYGHLSEGSLEGLSIGKPITKGERFAAIGTPDINGGWTPHLHFQIITDTLDLDCDFPGVGLISQREVWRSLSPDPNAILGIPSHRFPPREPDKIETLALRRNHIASNLSVAYKDPVKIARGWMQYLYDEEGRRYLDAYNNVPHVGHCHPRVVKAGSDQMAVLNTNTRYLHDSINRFAERLCDMLPDPLNVCFFVNSASEANELALRLCRARTGQRDMIVLESAYHGHTNTLIEISPYKHDGPGGAGPPSWVSRAPIPDTYRGIYKRDDPRAAEKYAQCVVDIIERMKRDGRGLAACIAESLPSVGGQIVFPEGYLPIVYAAVREAGGVAIADEVQTGYGRVGTHFWGFEAQGVVPDIVVLGKPIGNGHPLGAVITTPEIATSFDNGMEFFSTFGGNTVSCAIGLAVLDVVLEEKLQEHALRVGSRMIEGLSRLKDSHAIIGDVRGSGLFLGVELVRNRETLEPAAEEAAFIVDRLRDCGILLGTDGPYHNVIKIRPPMPFVESDADLLIATMGRILEEDFRA